MFTPFVYRLGAMLSFAALFLLPATGPALGSTPMPAALRSPRVDLSSDFLSRRMFLSWDLGMISDIVVDPRTGDITAAGSLGAVTWSANGKLKSRVSFNYETLFTADQTVSIVPLEKQRGFDYLGRRGSIPSGAMLFGTTGKTLWTSPMGDGVDEAAAADVLGRGQPQIVVGYNGFTGISMFDRGTAPIWNARDDGNVGTVALFAALAAQIYNYDSWHRSVITIYNPAG